MKPAHAMTAPAIQLGSPIAQRFQIATVIAAAASTANRSQPLKRNAPAAISSGKAIRPSAAESLREGLEETLTVLTLHLSSRLQRSLATTNPAERLISRTRLVKRNVKRWRGGQMMLRWVAAGVLEAVKAFHRLKGHADMPRLVAALRAHDQQLGLAVSPVGSVA